VGFSGVVHSLPESGFEPVPFGAYFTIPFPRIPVISFEGAKGDPFSPGFELALRMRNPNGFPLTLKSMDTWITLNDKKYDLLHTGHGATVIEPDSSDRVYMGMHHTKGKALSMILNMAQSESQEFALGGSVEFSTPYGIVYLPVELTGGLYSY